MNDPIILAAIEDLAKTGPLTPSRYVEAAADPASPLHRTLEWDDSVAGHEFRLYQARRIMATIVIHLPSSPRVIRALVHTPPASGRGEGEYVHVQTLVQQPTRLALARDEIIRLLESVQESLDDLDAAVAAFTPSTKTASASKRSKAARRHIAAARAAIQPIGV